MKKKEGGRVAPKKAVLPPSNHILYYALCFVIRFVEWHCWIFALRVRQVYRKQSRFSTGLLRGERVLCTEDGKGRYRLRETDDRHDSDPERRLAKLQSHVLLEAGLAERGS